jgi:hypothetical protein
MFASVMPDTEESESLLQASMHRIYCSSVAMRKVFGPEHGTVWLDYEVEEVDNTGRLWQQGVHYNVIQDKRDIREEPARCVILKIVEAVSKVGIATFSFLQLKDYPLNIEVFDGVPKVRFAQLDCKVNVDYTEHGVVTFERAKAVFVAFMHEYDMADRQLMCQLLDAVKPTPVAEAEAQAPGPSAAPSAGPVASTVV